MIYLYQAAFPTLIVLLYQIFYCKKKKNPRVYFCLFLFMCGSFYLIDTIFDNKLHAVESYECYVLTQAQKSEYEYAVNWHFDEAGKYVLDADSVLSSIKNRATQLASKAITTGIANGIVSRNITVTACCVAVVSLEELIGNLNETWKLVSYALNDAQYHVEMAVFYKAVLDNNEKW